MPQRRKRIYLVADFRGERATEILFECESVYGDTSKSREAWEGLAYNAERSAGGSCESWCIKGNFVDRETRQNGVGWRDDVSYTLDATDRHAVAVDCRDLEAISELSSTLQAKSNGGHSLNYQNPVVYDARGNGDGDTSPTLTGDHQNRITDYTAICVGNGQLHQTSLGDKTGALNCMHDQQAIIHKADPPRKYIVRRLTPLECCRLQGFPDWWEDGVDGSDTARYKMWGNGIALPCAADVLGRIAKAIRKG